MWTEKVPLNAKPYNVCLPQVCDSWRRNGTVKTNGRESGWWVIRQRDAFSVIYLLDS